MCNIPVSGFGFHPDIFIGGGGGRCIPLCYCTLHTYEIYVFRLSEITPGAFSYNICDRA